MATPQWLLVHKRLVPSPKDSEDQFVRNTRRRHKLAVESALRKGFLKTLDADLILQSQDEVHNEEAELEHVLRITIDSINPVQTIDCIALSSCSRLRLCNLSGSYLTDISAFRSCVNLLKLDLSQNQLTTLPGNSFWSALTQLRILHLHGNQLTDIEPLLSLNACPQLHILTAHNTPASLLPNYRHITVNYILSLKALDWHVISDEEVVENLRLPKKFKALTENFHIKLHRTAKKGVSYKGEVAGVYRLMLLVNRVLVHYSPVLIIQRYTRGALVRRHLRTSKETKIKAWFEEHQLLSKAESTDAILKKTVTRSFRSTLSLFDFPLKQQSLKPPTRRTSRTLGTPGAQQFPPPPPPPCSPAMSTLRSRHRHKSEHRAAQPLSSSWGGTEHRAGQRLSNSWRGSEHRSRQEGIRVEIKFTKSLQQMKEDETESSKLDNGETELPVQEDLCVAGGTTEIAHINRTAYNATAKQENRREIREAEKQILEKVREIRQPLKIDHAKVKPSISKDTHSFNRAHAAMSLNSLKALDQAYKAQDRAARLADKAKRVEEIRRERVIRREKVSKHKQAVRDAVLAWKTAEQQRLENEKEKLVEQEERRVVDKAIAVEEDLERSMKRQNDELFTREFRQQNTLVGNTLFKEDKRAVKESGAELIRQQVQEAREAAAERQEIVHSYMKMREEQMRRDVSATRKELNAKMIQLTSMRMLEAKQKVDREVARKQAAKAASELGAEAVTSSQRSHMNTTNLLNTMMSEGWRGPDKPGRKDSVRGAPSTSIHMRRMSREAHNTWQRGSLALAEGQLTSIHPLPALYYELHNTATPLMFDYHHPLPHFHRNAQPGSTASSFSEEQSYNNHWSLRPHLSDTPTRTVP